MKYIKSFLIYLLILFTFVSCNTKPTFSPNTENILSVHYIDVGQGDSILIQHNNKNMLIDSGSSKNKDKLINYLKDNNITKLDYVIATHPHEDHIGNMSTIIRKFYIGEFWAPKITNESSCFEKMVDALIEKDLKINVIKPKINAFDLGDDIQINILGPISNNYGDSLNQYSAVFKLTYGDISFLFMGDAEERNEKEFLSTRSDLTADVLKIGHHGSTTSTSKEFLTAVKPKYAVISVGKNNDFHHPSKKVLSNLEEKNINILRTDKKGTIIFSTDGSNLNYKCKK